MSLRFTKHQPKSGQFIAIWQYNNKPWSSIFKLECGLWYKFDQNEDEWERITHPKIHIPNHPDIVEIKYAHIR